jgi:hypothetical protein
VLFSHAGPDWPQEEGSKWSAGGKNLTRENRDNGDQNRCSLRLLLFNFNPMHRLFQKGTELTEAIIAAAIEVHRDKGPGLIESIYE